MAFETHFLDRLRDGMPLSSLIGRVVKLTKSGSEFKGCCPFHSEKTPSFTVNDSKGFFHCFGCGAHGDHLAFMMQSHNLSFIDAVEQMAAEVGIEVPAQTAEERQKAHRAASLYEICDKAAVFYEEQLWSTSGVAARDYLQARGISDDTARRFRLGWAPGNLLPHLRGQRYSDKDIAEAGVIYQNDNGLGDMLRDRLVFPITDRRGRVIAFGGRVLGDGKPKYLNTRGTALFDKGASLYGVAAARESIGKSQYALVVEGYIDVLACHQAGIATAVAPLGTAFGEEQAKLLWALAPEIRLCLDGDAAGVGAMERVIDRVFPLICPERTLSFVVLPSPEDPDSLIRKAGMRALEEKIEAPKPLIDAVWSLAATHARSDTPECLVAWEASLLRRAAVIKDAPTRRAYLGAFRRRFAEHGPPMPAILKRQSKHRQAPAPFSETVLDLWIKAQERADVTPVQDWLSRLGVPVAGLHTHNGGVGIAHGVMFKGRGKIGEEWATAAPLPLWEPKDGGAGLVILPAWADQVGGALIDLVAWNPRADTLAGLTGACAVLGQPLLNEARAYQAAGLPQKLTISASPLSWMARTAFGEDCCLVIDWRRVWEAFGGLTGLIAENVDLGERLSRACRPPRLTCPEIFVEEKPS